MPRKDRGPDQLRTVTLATNFTEHAESSVLCSFGRTRVLCTATGEERVPSHVKGSGRGWVTAEYGMLPRSTHTRSDREAAKGKQSGRTQEIQRLIGRALRAAVDLQTLGERQVLIDCDVLQADGGTRTAAITGGYAALGIALRRMQREKALRAPVAAISVGILRGQALLDLDDGEDCCGDVVMHDGGDRARELLVGQATAAASAWTPSAVRRECTARGMRRPTRSAAPGSSRRCAGFPRRSAQRTSSARSRSARPKASGSCARKDRWTEASRSRNGERTASGTIRSSCPRRRRERRWLSWTRQRRIACRIAGVRSRGCGRSWSGSRATAPYESLIHARKPCTSPALSAGRSAAW